MKSLKKVLFCFFALTFLFSCEPEEIPQTAEQEIYGTGDQEDPIDDKKY